MALSAAGNGPGGAGAPQSTPAGASARLPRGGTFKPPTRCDFAGKVTGVGGLTRRVSAPRPPCSTDLRAQPEWPVLCRTRTRRARRFREREAGPCRPATYAARPRRRRVLPTGGCWQRGLT
jgi:hypothetical protein